MRIATWNVNSVRARLPRVVDWLRKARPDVVCLQETKCVDEQFPREELEAEGYQCSVHGQKTYNGVAILSRDTPDEVVRGLPDDDADAEARVIAAQWGDLRVLNLYVVNGREVGHAMYDVKLQWLDRVGAYLRSDFPLTDKVIVLGDFNVTFDDRDVYDAERWHERILCSTPEREALARLMAPGLHDAFRKHHEEGGHYTWWDFRRRGFERGNRGLRIDHMLMSEPALDACTAMSIDTDERGMPKPSDHAPVLAELT